MKNRYRRTYPAKGVKALLALLTFQLLPAASYAQDEPEFRMEIGGAMALAAYEGDFNASVLKGMQPMAAIVAKYKMNPRMAWSAQIGTGRLKGSSKDVKTWYPVLWERPVDFSTSLTDFTVRYEYNFWPFGTGKEYLGAKPLTPFFAFGAGLAFAGKPKVNQAPAPEVPRTDPVLPEAADGSFATAAPEAAVAFQVPIGVGVKYKLRERLNLTAEWMMHFTGSDKIDGAKDPYGIKSDGIFKNTDCYSTLQLSITYDIWAKCKTCHNDRE